MIIEMTLFNFFYIILFIIFFLARYFMLNIKLRSYIEILSTFLICMLNCSGIVLLYLVKETLLIENLIRTITFFITTIILVQFLFDDFIYTDIFDIIVILGFPVIPIVKNKNSSLWKIINNYGNPWRILIITSIFSIVIIQLIVIILLWLNYLQNF